ncbi:hypothetical protein D3C72_1616970 [compost metagenome]
MEAARERRAPGPPAPGRAAPVSRSAQASSSAKATSATRGRSSAWLQAALSRLLAAGPWIQEAMYRDISSPETTSAPVKPYFSKRAWKSSRSEARTIACETARLTYFWLGSWRAVGRPWA